MVHFSRMAEELVLWNSAALGYVELDDAFCTRFVDDAAEKEPRRSRADQR